jgi:hemerythrin
MAQYRCPMAQRNRMAHAQFLAFLAGFQRRYVARGFDPADAHTLVALLDQWLANHIGRLDVELRSYVPQP